MNPRIFELIYFRNGKELPGLEGLLGAIEKMGYEVREVSVEEMDREFASLPLEAMFCNKEILLAGAENLFVLKPEYRTRFIGSLSKERN